MHRTGSYMQLSSISTWEGKVGLALRERYDFCPNSLDSQSRNKKPPIQSPFPQFSMSYMVTWWFFQSLASRIVLRGAEEYNIHLLYSQMTKEMENRHFQELFFPWCPLLKAEQRVLLNLLWQQVWEEEQPCCLFRVYWVLQGPRRGCFVKPIIVLAVKRG